MITIDVPRQVEETLRREFGTDLDRTAREALAVEAYRTEKLSVGQVAEMLGISIHEVEGLLKQRGVYLNYSVTDLEHDRESLKTLLDK
jgi:predicted HTH domain antitoxin